MILIIAAIILVLAGALVWSLLATVVLVRCPRCRRRGGWRLEALGERIEDLDGQGDVAVARGTVRCRACGALLEDYWSANDGRRLTEIVSRV